MESKYITFEGGELSHNLPVAIIFPYIITHSKMARCLNRLGKPISAGFVSVNYEGKVQAYGNSESLGLKSRPEDNKLLSKTLNCEYVRHENKN